MDTQKAVLDPVDLLGEIAEPNTQVRRHIVSTYKCYN